LIGSQPGTVLCRGEDHHACFPCRCARMQLFEGVPCRDAITFRLAYTMCTPFAHAGVRLGRAGSHHAHPKPFSAPHVRAVLCCTRCTAPHIRTVRKSTMSASKGIVLTHLRDTIPDLIGQPTRSHGARRLSTEHVRLVAGRAITPAHGRGRRMASSLRHPVGAVPPPSSTDPPPT
jgi:hypothetical protein